MPESFDKKREQLKTAFSLPALADTVAWLQEQELAMPKVNQGQFRLRLDAATEIASSLENYLACLAKSDALTMFTVPSPTDKQVLTWLQTEPLSVLRSLAPKYLDIFSRWGAQVKGDFPEAQAELFATAGILTWQGGPLEEYFAASRTGTLLQCLSGYCYVDKLAEKYHAAGIQVCREVRGLRTPTLVPPSLLVALIVLEARLARANSAMTISVAYTPSGHLLQDVAALRALQALTCELSVEVVCLPWAGGSLLGLDNLSTAAAWTVVTSALGSGRCCEVAAVDRDQPLTPEQIRVLLNLAQGLKQLVSDQQESIATAARWEEEQVKTEAQAIVNRVLELGQGEVSPGLERALSEGSLDIPLAPAGICHGQVLSARDATGAVRFLDCGALPLPKESKEYHRQLLEERAQAEGREPGISMAIDDIYAFSKGSLVGRTK